MPTLLEMAELAASLKSQIQQNTLRMRRAGVSADIPAEMLQALEQLSETIAQVECLDQLVEADERVQSTASASPSPDGVPAPTELLKRFALGVQSSVEAALQPWQNHFDSSTAKFGQLVAELQQSIKAFSQAEEDFAERLATIDGQRKQLAEQLEKAQSAQWRFTRQRKTLAQAIRAQRAELQLELTRAKAEFDQRLAESLDAEWAKADGEVAQLRKQLEAAEKKIAQLHSSSQEATSYLELQVKQQNHQLQSTLYELELARNQLAEASQAAVSSSQADQQLQAQIARLEKQAADAQEQLSQSCSRMSQLDSLIQGKERQLGQLRGQLDDKEQQLSAQTARLDDALANIYLLQSALDACADDDAEPDCQREDSQWKCKYEQAEAELDDLREQNSELATRIARLTTDSLSGRAGRGTVNSELLSWEERKKLMLQQLEQEHESDPESEVVQQQRVDFLELVATTQSEIQRRDREIEELREIVQLQSEARQGMAIGAAGVAQLLDSNDLINEERKKLQEIQQEWEAKLRQAEIDLSMERAKLARERAELELELAQLKRSSAQMQTAGQSQSDKQQRRWKNFLGLKEESSE
jgi:chromosome segregation ATPase